MLPNARAWLVLGLLAASACKGEAAAPTGPAAKYRVRVQVESIEGTGENARVVLSHEAVEGFKDRDGKAATMPAMMMAFGIAPEVNAGAFNPGTKHEIEFDVVWGREPTIRVTEAKLLPNDTALTLPPR